MIVSSYIHNQEVPTPGNAINQCDYTVLLPRRHEGSYTVPKEVPLREQNNRKTPGIDHNAV